MTQPRRAAVAARASARRIARPRTRRAAGLQLRGARLLRGVVASIDWQSLFFDPGAQWPARLTARARRRYGSTPDAEAAYNHALDEISRDGWARLREGYRGTGSADGFLAITFLNLMEEYAVRKYGRLRAPAWVQRLGTPWTRVYELLCLKRVAPETIVDELGAREGHGADLLRRAIADVRGRVTGCGERVGEQTTDDDVEPAPSGATAATELERGELAHLLDVLGGLFGGERRAQHSESSRDVRDARARIAALTADVRMTAEERLLLRLVYEENCTIPDAARALAMNERTARRAHQRLMSRLRVALTRHGFDSAMSVAE
jgi:hypothetical protein